MKNHHLDNLEDQEFGRKMMTIYSWIFPVIFASLGIIVLFGGAWICTLMLLVDSYIASPLASEKMKRWHIKGFLRVIICIAILVISMNLAGILYA